MERLLDPKNDWAFKQVFGQEKNKNILISFLNTMLENVQAPIVDVEFLKVDIDTEIIALRQSIVDVLCKAEDGRRFIVEMQKASDSGFIQRAVEYASRVYLNQRTIASKEKGDKGGRKNVCPIIFFAVMEKPLFESSACLSHHKIQDIATGKCEIKEMSFSFLELSKFHKKFDELNDDVDRWAYFFKHSDKVSPESLKKIQDSKTVFGEAYKEIERSAYTPEQLLEYARYQLKEEEIETRIADAEKKGRIETARRMLLKNMDINNIADFTQLPVSEIEKLTH